ncbi:SLAC1 anion channel family protein [Pseudomonas chlororaphis]|uniref:Tellurite resistance protein tehA n=1 Tax=Pseudomonas chlororaphis TaxID=587753 RepID=A0AAX3FT67_9PSED|nr:SLAC1 anion channel family protein [Pseudomonas chlororaphis]AZC39442.1 C4-dicarboxylate transporter/malic acid transport protein [Pseudomonas chlororaphis subsp. piscium]AZC45994.1 C4-dicarboxylate transporter/malic acid transport protein [Pseudomonas chlororaphis subsp. piscium]AZC52729.1 C4-dicarboxylate transporter/malic acid transport protein [Pseudomonas chlororaphis subsp. piscium]QHC91364.1 C4-dicarboxylate ABC transporter [Pseudomonas chlororaphis]WDG71527.1 SLAC1 anion channel fam
MDTFTNYTLKSGRPQLDYLPVGLFGSVMGLVGLSIAWREASHLYGMPVAIADGIGAVAVVVFVALVLGYGWKCLTDWQATKAEFQHPIIGTLFGSVLISLLLLPIVLVRVSPKLALGMWIVGAAGMTLFAWLIVSRWMSDRQQMLHATPAWIIPVVGLLDLPLAMPALNLPAATGLGVFALAIGLFFAVPLFTLIFTRLLFEAPLPDGLRPSLMILVAPFAVGYSTYTTVTGSHDIFAVALYMLTLFMLAVLFGQMRHLATCCPFRVSWWAVSFPLAASTICALRFAGVSPGLFTDGVALLLLCVASVAILGLFLRTLKGLLSGELRTLSS